VPRRNRRVVVRAGESNVTSADYILGHSEQELGRLARQAKLIDPITRRFFEAAGLRPGIRVLDIGTGAGHVAAMAAELVGSSGHVVGVDRSPRALSSARALMESRKLPNVSFLEGDPSEMTFDRAFDAVVGRYVLQFQPDPTAMVRALVRQVRPGGIVVFHELDWSSARSSPRVPLYDESFRWIAETVRQNGVEVNMGMKLHAAYLAAGLPAPELAMEAIIGGGENEDRIRLVTEAVGTIRDKAVAAGVATEAEMELDTLPERIAVQAKASGAVLVCRSEIGAWSRVPGSA